MVQNMSKTKLIGIIFRNRRDDVHFERGLLQGGTVPKKRDSIELLAFPVQKERKEQFH